MAASCLFWRVTNAFSGQSGSSIPISRTLLEGAVFCRLRSELLGTFAAVGGGGPEASLGQLSHVLNLAGSRAPREVEQAVGVLLGPCVLRQCSVSRGRPHRTTPRKHPLRQQSPQGKSRVRQRDRPANRAPGNKKEKTEEIPGSSVAKFLLLLTQPEHAHSRADAVCGMFGVQTKQASSSGLRRTPSYDLHQVLRLDGHGQNKALPPSTARIRETPRCVSISRHRGRQQALRQSPNIRRQTPTHSLLPRVPFCPSTWRWICTNLLTVCAGQKYRYRSIPSLPDMSPYPSRRRLDLHVSARASTGDPARLSFLHDALRHPPSSDLGARRAMRPWGRPTPFLSVARWLGPSSQIDKGPASAGETRTRATPAPCGFWGRTSPRNPAIAATLRGSGLRGCLSAVVDARTPQCYIDSQYPGFLAERLMCSDWGRQVFDLKSV